MAQPPPCKPELASGSQCLGGGCPPTPVKEPESRLGWARRTQPDLLSMWSVGCATSSIAVNARSPIPRNGGNRPPTCASLSVPPPSHSFLPALCPRSLSHRLHPALQACSLVRDAGPAAPGFPGLWSAVCGQLALRGYLERLQAQLQQLAQPRHPWRCG